MKIPAPYRQDAPTAAEPVATPVWSNKPPKTKPKGEVRTDAHQHKPCDRCLGRHHDQYHQLKYVPLPKQWLCQHCRDNTILVDAAHYQALVDIRDKYEPVR